MELDKGCIVQACDVVAAQRGAAGSSAARRTYTRQTQQLRLKIGRSMTAFDGSIPPHPDPLPPGEREVVYWPILSDGLGVSARSGHDYTLPRG